MKDRSRAMLEVITGCMYAGKTDELLRRLRRERIIGKVQLFKPSIDTRYSADKVVTHDRTSLEAVSIPPEYADKILDNIRPETTVIGIDEAQFFGPGIVEVCLKLIEKGYKVICAGLKQDFRGEPFGQMADLLVYAHRITVLSAVCNVCGRDAYMTQRLVNGKPADAAQPQVQVGGLEAYEARCVEHYQPPR